MSTPLIYKVKAKGLFLSDNHNLTRMVDHYELDDTCHTAMLTTEFHTYGHVNGGLLRGGGWNPVGLVTQYT